MSYTDQFTPWALGHLVTARPYMHCSDLAMLGDVKCVWVVDVAIEKMMGKV